MDLNHETVRRIAALFPASERDEAGRLLVAECGPPLGGFEGSGPAGVKRVRFAVL